MSPSTRSSKWALIILVTPSLVSGSLQLSALNEFTASFEPVLISPACGDGSDDTATTRPLVPSQIASGQFAFNFPERQVKITADVNAEGATLHATLKIDASRGYASFEVVEHVTGRSPIPITRSALCEKVSFPPQRVPRLPPRITDHMVPPGFVKQLDRVTIDGTGCIAAPNFCRSPRLAVDADSSLPVFLTLAEVIRHIELETHSSVVPRREAAITGLKFFDAQPSAAAFDETTCVAQDLSSTGLTRGALQALLTEMQAPLRGFRSEDGPMRELLLTIPGDLSVLAAPPTGTPGANLLPFCAGAAVSALAAALLVVVSRARAVKSVDSSYFLA